MYSVSIEKNWLSFSDKENNLLFKEQTNEQDNSFEVFGIFGLITFNDQKYLLLITKAEEVGSIDNNTVFEVKGAKVIVIQPNEKVTNTEMIKKGLESFFLHPGLYFSKYPLYSRYQLSKDKEYSNDLSSTEEKISQKKQDSSVDLNKKALNEFAKTLDIKESLEESNEHPKREKEGKTEYADLIEPEESNDFNALHLKNLKRNNEFLFNKKPINSLLSKYKSLNFENPEILKCIQGNFSSFKDFVLISRRCPKRLGARFFSRGIGKDGFPSNFVETEQIIVNKNSYLQIRGSIPLKWYHNVDFQFHPVLKVLPFKTELLISHAILERMYRVPVIYLNLIHSLGYESELFRKFNELYKPNHDLFYNFDFKNEIHKEEFPFEFTKTSFSSKINDQKEIIRTNCIDCLDRTNSMQYIIGKSQFELQLKEAGIENQKEYIEAFKNAFYENGNNISLQYAGTNAMRSYYITDGGKSIWGLLKDGFYALYRYYINRFKHGKYHTIVNIIVGNLEEGKVDFNTKLIAFKKLPSWKLFFILPIFLFLFKKSSNFYLKILFTFLFAIYIACFILQIDVPTFTFDEFIESE